MNVISSTDNMSCKYSFLFDMSTIILELLFHLEFYSNSYTSKYSRKINHTFMYVGCFFPDDQFFTIFTTNFIGDYNYSEFVDVKKKC